jgi:hypothetical protein
MKGREKDLSFKGAEDGRKTILFEDGKSQVITDKNGKPVVATQYLERLTKKKAKAQIGVLKEKLVEKKSRERIREEIEKAGGKVPVRRGLNIKS